jgi:purine nucleoside phosphorylase
VRHQRKVGPFTERTVFTQSHHFTAMQYRGRGALMTKAVLGVIGGSGLYDLRGLDEKMRQKARI